MTIRDAGPIAGGVIESFITEGVKGSSRGTRTVNITNAGMNKIRPCRRDA